MGEQLEGGPLDVVGLARGEIGREHQQSGGTGVNVRGHGLSQLAGVDSGQGKRYASRPGDSRPSGFRTSAGGVWKDFRLRLMRGAPHLLNSWLERTHELIHLL